MIQRYQPNQASLASALISNCTHHHYALLAVARESTINGMRKVEHWYRFSKFLSIHKPGRLKSSPTVQLIVLCSRKFLRRTDSWASIVYQGAEKRSQLRPIKCELREVLIASSR